MLMFEMERNFFGKMAILIQVAGASLISYIYP